MQLIPEVTFLSGHKSRIKVTSSLSCGLSSNKTGTEASRSLPGHTLAVAQLCWPSICRAWKAPQLPLKSSQWAFSVGAHWRVGKELNSYLKSSFDKLGGTGERLCPRVAKALQGEWEGRLQPGPAACVRPGSDRNLRKLKPQGAYLAAWVRKLRFLKSL